MKSFLAKLRRKPAGSTDTTEHPDLSPLVDSDFSETEYLPEVEQVKPSSTSAKFATDPEEISADGFHPDLHVFEPEVSVTDARHDSYGEDPERKVTPSSGQQRSITERPTEFEAETEVSDKAKPDADPGLASPDQGSVSGNIELDFLEADDEYDDLIDEDNEFSEPADELWAAEPSYEISQQIEGIDADNASFEAGDFGEFSVFSPRQVENETDNAQWENLLDLDLFEEAPDPSDAFHEEYTITDGDQLDDYAARLVSQMRIIRLDQRPLLQKRWKAVLEEFPFPSSYRALSRLVRAGTGLGELEDACDLKCLWRESPWLWSHRKFNKMQRAWETEERSNYRNALSWKLALTLIHRVGRVEAERRILEDWRKEWLEMQLEHSSEEGHVDPRFWSYPSFLGRSDESMELAEADAWYYEEPIDNQPWSSFRLEDSEGQIWRFEPKDGRFDTGYLSLLPHSKRVAAQEEAEAKEANKDA